MEQFAQEITVIDLPSLTWSIHIQEKYEFIAILHVKLTSDEIIIDKGIVLTEGDDKLEVKVFLNGLVAHLPNITSTPTVPELSTLVAILHKQKVCLNAADNVSHPHCVKLVQNSVCKEERGSANYCKVCKNNCELPDPNPILLEECDELIKKEEIQIDFPNEELDSETTQFTDKRGLCNVCGKIFSSTYRMQEHLLTHSSEKKFQCKTCDKTFTKSFNLRMHEHTHSGHLCIKL
ncbi:hypothetical protein NQ318_013753 [Aromia moschata]|uniref:C2H2-type domain-containing protein n=1 Tax=Aromia moschata TaxID=1265417 RepID=A0AAV8ZBF9_9CUCU|nr:hypothetical protein NQ318_013753 [Aromia moschata]